MAGVIAFVDDLMFVSRIREAARGVGVEVQTARRVTDLLAACREGGRLVILDLDSARLPVREALGALRADPDLARVATASSAE